MKKSVRALALALSVLLLLTSLSGLTGCGKKKGYQKNPLLDTTETVILSLASGNQTWPEMENIVAKFEAIYPNCTVNLVYIEDYTTNLETRLSQSEQKVDLFKTVNIQATTAYKDNAYNLISEYAQKYLDLSGTNAGIVSNFRYAGTTDEQYAIPYGGEMRGMYVNVSLLKSVGLEVPTNRAELLNCCAVLKEHGYIPLQSSNGTFAQQLLYPYICNSIVNGGNYEEVYASIENIDDGISEYFEDAYSFLYDIVKEGYYDYKQVEERYGYDFNSSVDKAREFLNIKETSEDVYEKQEGVGNIAFMTDTQGFELDLAKVKSDYYSEIEYEFILSPVGEDGGYAYLSPSDGLAVNKDSDHLDWSLEFLNYFFTPEVNTEFAEICGKIPNTTDGLIKYDVAADHTSNVGQVTFSYTFYKTVTTPMLGGYSDMVGISKMNAQKYMNDNGDGTYSFKFTLQNYLDRLETEFQAIKAARTEQ